MEESKGVVLDKLLERLPPMRDILHMVQRLGRVGDESAESETSRPSRIRLGPLRDGVRFTSRSTQLREYRLGRESEFTRSTRHYDNNFMPHRNSM